MSDVRRIVTLDSEGTVTTVIDLELVGFAKAHRDSFKVTPPAARQIVASRSRRYGGGRVVGETHDNGAISETIRAFGTDADDCLKNVRSIYSALRSSRVDLFFQWKPEGATVSTFFQIMGPATLDPTYRWTDFAGRTGLDLSISIPVAPLALLAPYTLTFTNQTLPAVVELGAITGDAPALADVSIRHKNGTDAPIWALLAWWLDPDDDPLAGSVAPMGVIEGETATALSGFASSAAAGARGGNALRVTAAGAGSASASWVVDPSVLQADDFADGEVDVEVWARLSLDSGLVSPKAVLSLAPDAGTNFGNPTYSSEYAAAGKLLTKPSASSAYRFVRLGVLTMPVDPDAPVKWRIKLDASWAAGSAGDLLVDYLVCAPARARACSKTGVPNDAYYPRFIKSTSDTTKTVRSDLSGRVGAAAGNQARDSGLCGSLIELPPGDVNLLIKLSSLVPDNPTADTTTEQLAHTGVSGSVVVWPRVHLVGTDD